MVTGRRGKRARRAESTERKKERVDWRDSTKTKFDRVWRGHTKPKRGTSYTSRVANDKEKRSNSETTIVILHPIKFPFPFVHHLSILPCLYSHPPSDFLHHLQVPTRLWLHACYRRLPLEGLPQMKNTMTIIASSPTCVHTYAQRLASHKLLRRG